MPSCRVKKLDVRINAITKYVSEVKSVTSKWGHSFSNFSLVPQMYGVYRMISLSSNWLFSSRFLGGCENVFFGICSGKPLAVKTSSRCCISTGLLVSSQTWRARFRIPRIAPVRTLGWWWEWKGMYQSVCLGLWYTEVDRWSPSLDTRTSGVEQLWDSEMIISIRKKWSGIELILVEMVTEVVVLYIQIVT